MRINNFRDIKKWIYEDYFEVVDDQEVLKGLHMTIICERGLVTFKFDDYRDNTTCTFSNTKDAILKMKKDEFIKFINEGLYYSNHFEM